jgi:hypothetical protein
VVMLVASCSGLLKKKEEDAGAEAAVAEVVDAAPAPTPAALATNEGDVARFPDEEKLADVHATMLRPYSVREAPPAGTIVIGVGKGTAVTQIAKRDRYILILVDNPKSAGTKLMGWVHRDAFSAVVQDAGPLVCPTGEIALFGDTPFCGKLCSSDADCPSAPTTQACKGQANKLLPNGKAGDGVTVCTVFHAHDAGAPSPPAPADAGKPPAPADAGKAETKDAGPAPTPPGPAADVVTPTDGKCPGNFVFVNQTKKCHRPCPGGITAHECKNAKPYCIKCDSSTKKVCADDRNDCK